MGRERKSSPDLGIEGGLFERRDVEGSRELGMEFLLE